MKRTFLLTSIICLGIFISLTSLRTVSSNGLVDDVLNYTNKFRRSHGLHALIIRQDLNAIAQKHSEDMATGRAGFGHSSFDQRFSQARKTIKGFKSFAENVAYGAGSGKEVVNMWKNSAGHRKNILGTYRYIGIGTAKDRRGIIYYTEVFAN